MNIIAVSHCPIAYTACAVEDDERRRVIAGTVEHNAVGNSNKLIAAVCENFIQSAVFIIGKEYRVVAVDIDFDEVSATGKCRSADNFKRCGKRYAGYKRIIERAATETDEFIADFYRTYAARLAVAVFILRGNIECRSINLFNVRKIERTKIETIIERRVAYLYGICKITVGYSRAIEAAGIKIFNA